MQVRNAALLQGLQQLGWTVGQNVQIDYRWSGGNIDDTRRYAAELVALAPDVIFAPGTAAVGPLQQVTRTVPIVFVILIDLGIGAKWLEVLKEIAPNVTRAAVIRDPAIAAGLGMWAAIQSVSPSAAIRSKSARRRLPARRKGAAPDER